MTFTARDWLAIFNQLRSMGQSEMAGRISHNVGHAWNNDNWNDTFTIDFTGDEMNLITDFLGDAGLHNL